MLSLPPPIRTSDPGSFAHQTFSERLPKIIAAVLAQNNYPPSVREDLLSLQAELNQPIPVRPLSASQPDAASWNASLAAFSNAAWLDLPFYFAEAFFYRRLLETVRYFDPGLAQGHDPFQSAKDAQIVKDVRHFELALEGLSAQPEETRCETLLSHCLWGNQVDLSNFFTDFDQHLNQESSSRLIIDHARPIARLLAQGVRSLAYILDNVGIELYFDLGLVDFLLALGWVEQVTIHLKDCPFFLSDAMLKDLLASLRTLKDSPSLLSRNVASRLEEAMAQGRLLLKFDPLWTSSLTYIEVPAEINRLLGDAGLAIFKGDLNYRRLLGDYHWDPTARIQDILSYLQVPVAVLRTPKSEIVAGLSSAQVRHLAETDPQWLINGEHGIIQLIGS